MDVQVDEVAGRHRAGHSQGSRRTGSAGRKVGPVPVSRGRASAYATAYADRDRPRRHRDRPPPARTVGLRGRPASRLSVMIACTIRGEPLARPARAPGAASAAAISASRCGSRSRAPDGRLVPLDDARSGRPAGPAGRRARRRPRRSGRGRTPAGRRRARPSGRRARASSLRRAVGALELDQPVPARRTSRAGPLLSKTHRQNPLGRCALTTSSSAQPMPWPWWSGCDVEVVEPRPGEPGVAHHCAGQLGDPDRVAGHPGRHPLTHLVGRVHSGRHRAPHGGPRGGSPRPAPRRRPPRDAAAGRSEVSRHHG